MNKGRAAEIVGQRGGFSKIQSADNAQVRIASRKRGRPPLELERVKEAIRDALRREEYTIDQLTAMLEKDLAARYDVSRYTARKARDAVLSERVENSF
jgi:hypothetical protein